MQVTIVNRNGIQVHKPGCKDLKRNARGASMWDAEVNTFRDVVLATYDPTDFDYDPDTEWENYAGDIQVANCCPKLAEESAPAPAKSVRRQQLDHRTQCTHPQTPAARRACRKAHGGVDSSTAKDEVPVAPQPVAPKLEVFPARGQGRSKPSKNK
jgi:hypothetical protein